VWACVGRRGTGILGGCVKANVIAVMCALQGVKPRVNLAGSVGLVRDRSSVAQIVGGVDALCACGKGVVCTVVLRSQLTKIYVMEKRQTSVAVYSWVDLVGDIGTVRASSASHSLVTSTVVC
jgi:hypothetical protein